MRVENSIGKYKIISLQYYLYGNNQKKNTSKNG